MSRPEPPRIMPFTDEHKYLYTDPIFLIGNGNSRKNFDLERLRGRGTIIGCNALYREFTPDLLIAIDQKMLTEIDKADYKGLCLSPANRTKGSIKDSLKWRTERFNTSGCFAMKMITELMKPSKCYMLGMDGFPGNMYDGTLNYAANTLQNFSGVLSFYMKVLQTSKNTIFINVNTQDAWPPEAKDTGSYEFMTTETFEKTVMI